jgi:hypothetical protein
VALAVVLVLARLTVYLVSSHAHAPAAVTKPSARVLKASHAPPGRILSLTGSQDLALSDLRGGRPTVLSSLGKFSPAPAPTLDNRYLVSPYAQLIAFSTPGRPMVTPMSDFDENYYSGYWSTVSVEPLADHDRDVVLNSGSANSGNNPIGISSLATGKTYSPWQADNVSGDPQAVGIFASVARPFQTSSQPSDAFPDASVQLLDFGRPRVVLASAAQLNSDVKLPATTPTLFFPYPSPGGDMVAVVVQPIAPPGVSSTAGGVVILTRTGRERASFGNIGGLVSPAWSSSGTLAFAASTGHGSVLDIWNADGQSSFQKLPAAGGDQYGNCIWSPDGAWILCAASDANQTNQDWVVASASGGPVVVTHGPGLPISWLGDTE